MASSPLWPGWWLGSSEAQRLASGHAAQPEDATQPPSSAAPSVSLPSENLGSATNTPLASAGTAHWMNTDAALARAVAAGGCCTAQPTTPLLGMDATGLGSLLDLQSYYRLLQLSSLQSPSLSSWYSYLAELRSHPALAAAYTDPRLLAYYTSLLTPATSESKPQTNRGTSPISVCCEWPTTSSTITPSASSGLLVPAASIAGAGSRHRLPSPRRRSLTSAAVQERPPLSRAERRHKETVEVKPLQRSRAVRTPHQRERETKQETGARLPVVVPPVNYTEQTEPLCLKVSPRSDTSSSNARLPVKIEDFSDLSVCRQRTKAAKTPTKVKTDHSIAGIVGTNQLNSVKPETKGSDPKPAVVIPADDKPLTARPSVTQSDPVSRPRHISSNTTSSKQTRHRTRKPSVTSDAATTTSSTKEESDAAAPPVASSLDVLSAVAVGADRLCTTTNSDESLQQQHGSHLGTQEQGQSSHQDAQEQQRDSSLNPQEQGHGSHLDTQEQGHGSGLDALASAATLRLHSDEPPPLSPPTRTSETMSALDYLCAAVSERENTDVSNTTEPQSDDECDSDVPEFTAVSITTRSRSAAPRHHSAPAALATVSDSEPAALATVSDSAPAALATVRDDRELFHGLTPALCSEQVRDFARAGFRRASLDSVFSSPPYNTTSQHPFSDSEQLIQPSILSGSSVQEETGRAIQLRRQLADIQKRYRERQKELAQLAPRAARRHTLQLQKRLATKLAEQRRHMLRQEQIESTVAAVGETEDAEVVETTLSSRSQTPTPPASPVESCSGATQSKKRKPQKPTKRSFFDRTETETIVNKKSRYLTNSVDEGEVEQSLLELQADRPQTSPHTTHHLPELPATQTQPCTVDVDTCLESEEGEGKVDMTSFDMWPRRSERIFLSPSKSEAITCPQSPTLSPGSRSVDGKLKSKKEQTPRARAGSVAVESVRCNSSNERPRKRRASAAVSCVSAPLSDGCVPAPLADGCVPAPRSDGCAPAPLADSSVTVPSDYRFTPVVLLDKPVKVEPSDDVCCKSPANDTSDDVPLLQLCTSPTLKPNDGVELRLRPSELKDGLELLVLIDSLTYEAQLKAIHPPDIYGVSVHGERRNKPHIFTREELLSQAIHSIQPVSMEQVPLGKRICARWSTQFKHMHAGRIASQPKPGDTLVSVEFDDEDEGNIKLSEMRLVPESYPNIEPLLEDTAGTPPPPILPPATDLPPLGSIGASVTHALTSPEAKPFSTSMTSPRAKGRKRKRSSCISVADDNEAEEVSWHWLGAPTQRKGQRGRAKKDFYKAIQRGDEILHVGDSVVLLGYERSLPYIGQIMSLWEDWEGKMWVKNKWFYHPQETQGARKVPESKAALFQSSHTDQNLVQTISHKCHVMSYTEFSAMKKPIAANTYYLAGFYEPTMGLITHESDVPAH